jgi:hypothetical protein
MIIMRIVLLSIAFFSITILIGCSAVPTRRYEGQKDDIILTTDENKNEKSMDKSDFALEKKLKQNEDYDISRLSPKLDIEVDVKKNNMHSAKEIWYSYPISDDYKKTKKIISTSDGYRVLVATSDDLLEIETIQQRLENYKSIYQIYSIFEPPFYKLYIGDFSSVENANSLKNKLIHLGFRDSKVIRTTINIFDK